MPQVGSRHYSYTPKGQMAARKAKKTGKKIVNRMPKKKRSMLS